MLASAHFNGPYKNNWGGEKNFTIAISANWSGMQLFPRSTSLFRKKRLISPRLERETSPDMWPGHPEVSQTWVQGQKKALSAPSSAFLHMHLGTKTHVLDSRALSFPPYIPFCSSHLLWSKAFPAHLLSPVRWLSNNSCYLVVNRWESELNLFRKSLRFGLSTVNSASGKPSWKAYVNQD